MNRKKFEAATDFLLDNKHKIEIRERSYKVPGAEKIHAHLQAFLEGNPASVNVNLDNALDILDWRVIELLNSVAVTSPEVFRQALKTLWSLPLTAKRADNFWSALDPALGSVPAIVSKAVNGLGTRASVASYFLFLADPVKFPFYRPSYGGKAIEYLYERKEALDQASPGALLHDYGLRCAFLLREFKDAGLPLQDMLDLQSALYVMVSEHVDRK
ncbi:hypothetical protein [Deinococcus sp. UYEF24]